jgi:hypothetical protein
VKALSVLVSLAASLFGLQMVIFSLCPNMVVRVCLCLYLCVCIYMCVCVCVCVCVCPLISSSYKDSHTGLGLTLMASFYLNHIFKHP